MKQYLVIGGSSGIGKSLVEKLGEQHQVYATYHNHEQPSQGNIRYYHLNSLDEQADWSFLPETLDGLVYCPGSIVLKPAARITETELLDHFKLNVSGALRCIQKCLPLLKKSTNPSILLFSTVAVQTGMPFHSIVSACKGAVEGLCRSLAAELAPTIRVNCIAPSLTDTPLASSLLSSEEKKLAAATRHPLKRIGTPNDMASLAAFLLSDDAQWISGQILHVDGGMSNLRV
jgi:NAD(P)-dependent dehydrogenase (short-subunit alcohol dehydrogenase family)